MRKRLFLGVSLLLALLLVACGSANNQTIYEAAPSSSAAQEAGSSRMGLAGSAKAVADTADYYDGEVYEEEAVYDDVAEDVPLTPTTGGGNPSADPTTYERKIVITYDLSLQTKEFDAGVESLQKLVGEYNGYIEYSYVDGKNLYDEFGRRYANFTFRIPSERLEEFVNGLGEQFNLLSKQQTSADITGSYYDTDSRLKVLEIQEERLLAMLEESAELQYLLEVERELSSVRSEIESLNTMLKLMDTNVSMSTVTVSLEEVIEYDEVKNEPVNFGERISKILERSGKDFVAFWEDALFSLILWAPNLIIFAVVVLVIVIIIRGRRKTKKKKRVEALEKSRQTSGESVKAPEQASQDEQKE